MKSLIEIHVRYFLRNIFCEIFPLTHKKMSTTEMSSPQTAYNWTLLSCMHVAKSMFNKMETELFNICPDILAEELDSRIGDYNSMANVIIDYEKHLAILNVQNSDVEYEWTAIPDKNIFWLCVFLVHKSYKQWVAEMTKYLLGSSFYELGEIKHYITILTILKIILQKQTKLYTK